MRNLQRTLAGYLCLRRNLGFKMLNESAALPAFVSFVENRRSPYITTRLALDWAQQGREGQSKWRFYMVRGLAKYAAIFDARTEVPQPGLLRTKYPCPRPYIYSDQEIKRLLSAAWNWGHDRPISTYYSLLGLLAVSGLRLGEANFLTRPEAEALLGAPDLATPLGRRDHALMLLALQTGLRLSELISLSKEDLSLQRGLMCESSGKVGKNDARHSQSAPYKS